MKPVASFFVLLLFAAVIGGGAYIYIQSQSGTSNQSAPATPTPDPNASSLIGTIVTPTPSPTVTTSPSPSPTSTASTISQRTISASDNLSVINQLVAVPTGGSLFQIASDHNIDLTTLAALNNISDPNTVYAGQQIIIPDTFDSNSMTILFALNKSREAAEAAKLKSGLVSIYTDPTSAAQNDLKGIYDLNTSTPYSKIAESAASVTLTNSSGTRLTTVMMSKTADGLWYASKAVINTNSSPTPTPTISAPSQ